jgi:hypothetical protein
MAQKNKGVWWRKYKWQLNAALQRGIPWRFTFDEWCELWRESGKWDQRGRHKGQYVMARFGDAGPYQRDNVRICTVGDNTDEMRAALPIRTWRGLAADRAANREEARKKREGRVLVRPAMAEAAFGRRIVIRDGRRAWARPGDKDYPG